MGWAKRGKSGRGTERDFASGSGHSVQGARGVLLSCTLETCTPINSIKNKKNKINFKIKEIFSI